MPPEKVRGEQVVVAYRGERFLEELLGKSGQCDTGAGAR